MYLVASVIRPGTGIGSKNISTIALIILRYELHKWYGKLLAGTIGDGLALIVSITSIGSIP